MQWRDQDGHAKRHTVGASPTETGLLTILEAGSLGSRSLQGGFLRGLSPRRVDDRLLPVPSRGPPAVCVCVLNPFSHKDTSYKGLESP